MEVNEAIECLEVASEFQVSINRQEEIKRVISLLKSLEAENKVYRNEQSGWVKEIERRQAKIRELEKLDLNVRELMLENKKLKKENKALRKDKWELEGINEACRKENEAYRGMWEALWDVLELCTIYDSKRKGIQTYAEVILPELEQKYLGGGE